MPRPGEKRMTGYAVAVILEEGLEQTCRRRDSIVTLTPYCLKLLS